jgi:hypothetical protein
MFSLLISLLTVNAHAAEITALPPSKRGDLGLSYRATVVPDELIEDGTVVGRRQATDHLLTYSGRVGLTDILALELALPHAVSSRIRFTESHRMVYDPNTGTGSMLGTDAIGHPTEVAGKGLGGTQIALAVTPFSESHFSSRGDQLTWLLRAGYRTADKTNFWTETGGQRGALDGASALILDTAFSTTHGIVQPYLGLSYDKRFSLKTGVTNTGGMLGGKNVKLRPASTLMLRSGMEIEVFRDEAWAEGLGTAVMVDPSARFGWRSGAQVPSGVYLPSVLSVTEDTSVAQGQASELWAGVGLTWRIIRYVDWKVQAELGSPLSYQVEHPYEISTGMGDMSWTAGTSLTFRMRDPLFDSQAQ